MNLPDDIFENTHSLELHYNKHNNFWRITTTHGVGRGSSLPEAIENLRHSQQISELQLRLNKYMGTHLSPSQIESLDKFLKANNG